jgi:hypothetical protein
MTLVGEWAVGDPVRRNPFPYCDGTHRWEWAQHLSRKGNGIREANGCRMYFSGVQRLMPAGTRQVTWVSMATPREAHQ